MFGFYLTLDGSRNGTSIPKAVARCFGIQSIKAWRHILTNANNIQLCLRKIGPWVRFWSNSVHLHVLNESSDLGFSPCVRRWQLSCCVQSLSSLICRSSEDVQREDMRVTVTMHARCCQWLNVDYWMIWIKIECLHISGLYMCCHKGPWWRLLGLPHAITICVACPGVTSPCHVLPFSQVARLGRTVPTLQPEKTYATSLDILLYIYLCIDMSWIFLVSSPTLFQLIYYFFKWYVAELVVTVVYKLQWITMN